MPGRNTRGQVALAALCLALLLASSSQALAQSAATGPSSAPYQGYGLFQGGVTLANNQKPTIGIEFAQAVHPNVDAYGTINWVQDVTPDEFQNEWNALADALTDFTGVPVTLQSQLKAWLGAAGVKVLLSRGRVRPYVMGGLGAIRFETVIREVSVGDVTDSLVEQGFIAEDRVTYAKFLAEAGAGVSMAVGGDAFVDVGYRHRKPIDTTFSFGAFYAGFGWRY